MKSSMTSIMKSLMKSLIKFLDEMINEILIAILGNLEIPTKSKSISIKHQKIRKITFLLKSHKIPFKFLTRGHGFFKSCFVQSLHILNFMFKPKNSRFWIFIGYMMYGFLSQALLSMISLICTRRHVQGYNLFKILKYRSDFLKRDQNHYPKSHQKI